MADQPAPQPAPAAPQPVRMQVLAQFVKDLSFENAVAQKGMTASEVQPDIQVGVGLDARKRAVENHYDVTAKFTISNKNKASGETLFLMELSYGGVFLVENVPEDRIHPFLLIECPKVLFPFIRRIVSDVTRDGGFPQLNLEMVDFQQLYVQELARRAQAQAQPALTN